MLCRFAAISLLMLTPQVQYEHVRPEERSGRLSLITSQAFLEAKALGCDLAAERLGPLVDKVPR